MYYELTDSFIVKSGIEQTWEFFSSAEKLPLITPSWLGFTVLTDTSVTIQRDTVLDYAIRWMGLRLKWRSLIIDWSPMRQFIDLQIRGPYVLWHHQHSFQPHAEGTLCMDRVIYKLPIPLVSRFVQRAIIKRQLRRIFEFRRKVIGEELGWVKAAQPEVRIVKLR